SSSLILSNGGTWYGNELSVSNGFSAVLEFCMGDVCAKTEITVMWVIATIMPSAASKVVNFVTEREGKYMVRTLRTLAPPGNSDYARTVMKLFVAILSLVPSIAVATTDTPPTFDEKTAERFAKLALACVEKEYPNKISHVLNSDADVAPPRQLTPAFYGCYDWHSSVHGHWLLVRLLRTFPNAPFAAPARDALRKSLSAENLKHESAYIRGEGRTSFERPYGLAWLLQLCAE